MTASTVILIIVSLIYLKIDVGRRQKKEEADDSRRSKTTTRF